ncbi:MAG TPA: nicotinate-nucleotide--dimethylbenzimidazole phosphoribosyltransferase [Nakamurella sp.]|nr:nicotinate-nucleotide--dimethylbenzimidazole phosphoribosyltransferase [Nakamurella sp.]
MTLDLPAVPTPDLAAAASAAARRDRLPAGALGVWGAVLDTLAAARGSATGSLTPLRPRLVVMAADHGIADSGVSAAIPADTARRVADLTAGVGLTATLAAVTGVGVRVVQAGPRSGRIDIEDALDDDQLEAAIATGRQIADAEVDEGADLLIGAVCGVGVSTPVSVLVAVLTGMEPVDATTRGSGIDDAAWITKAAAVRDALFRVRRAGSDVLTLLRTGGGADIAALTGFIAQAAIRRTPVLIHDLPSTVCGVLAHRLAPGADSYLLASSLSPERGHRRLLDMLGREPLTDWSITAGSGVAALLVVPSLRAAAQAVDAVLAVDEAAGSPERVTRSAHAIDAWDPELL